jgi:hypothetical protein
VPVSELDEDTARALSGIEVQSIKGENSELIWTHKVKTNDKRGALARLGKHLKMWTEKREVELETDTLEAFIQKVSENHDALRPPGQRKKPS